MSASERRSVLCVEQPRWMSSNNHSNTVRNAVRIWMNGIWGEQMRRIDGVDFAGDFSIPIAKSKNIYQRLDGEWVELTPVKHCHNESEVADCDEFICSNCHIHLEGYAWVDIDDDDGEKTYHEFSCRFCPQCGAKVE